MVFGATAPPRSTPAGQRLLAHELTHVVQQAGGSPSQSDAVLEREADRAEQAFDSNATLAVSGQTRRHMQRKEAGGIGDELKEQAITQALSLIGLGPTGQRLVRSGIDGAVEGFSEQWNKKDGTGELLGKEMKKFSATDLPALIGGYLTGVVRGVVSPITDLFQILVLGEQARDFADKIAQSALSNGGALAAELNEISAAVSQLVAPLRGVWATMRANKLDTLRMLFGFADAQSAMVQQMEQMAASLGRTGGTSIAKALEAPWKKEEAKTETKFDPFKQTAQYLNQKGEQLVDALLSGPWGKVGDTAGYALGFAAVQVALLVFSEGIGNLITEIGKGLGTLAKAGTLLGRGLEGVGKFVEAAGATIKFVEGAIDGVMGFLAKPLLPILKPVLEPFGKAMEKLSGVLRRLLGIAEKDSAHLAVTAIAKTESGLASHAHLPSPTTPKPAVHSSGGAPGVHPASTAPAGHAGAPHVAAAEAVTPPHAPTRAPAATAKAEPPTTLAHAGKTPPPESHAPHAGPENKSPGTDGPRGGAAPDQRGKVLAEEPVGEGHHVQVRESGDIELCSPAPCPLLENIYGDIIGGSLPMKKELAEIKKLRSSNPKEAARRSALLKKELDQAALRASALERKLRKQEARSGKKEPKIEFKPAGDLVEFGRHGSARTNRTAAGLQGHESGHVAPQAVMKQAPDYNPRDALTRFLDPANHRGMTGMDHFWKNDFDALRAARMAGAPGKQPQATVQELHDIVANAIRRSSLPPGEKRSLIARLSDEMFVESGLSPTQLLNIPKGYRQ